MLLLFFEQVKSGKTRDEMYKLFEDYPQSKDFIHKYQYMIDDDTYDFPHNFIEQTLHEDCN